MSITENGNKNHMVLANQKNIAEFGNDWLSGNYDEHIQFVLLIRFHFYQHFLSHPVYLSRYVIIRTLKLYSYASRVCCYLLVRCTSN